MGTSRYVINFDESFNQIRDLLKYTVKDKVESPERIEDLERKLEDIKELLPAERYKELKHNISLLAGNLEFSGNQKIESRFINIPAIKGNYKEIFSFDKSIGITGVTFSQSGWKKEDKWSLEIDKNIIFNNLGTKEIGDHKYLSNPYNIEKGTPISFIVHNFSGNSRQVWVDIEYVEKVEFVPSDGVDVDDIENEWNIAVKMQWESNSEADIDLYGVISDEKGIYDKVWYRRRESDNLHLNFDYTRHLNDNDYKEKPEIISLKNCKDYKDKKIQIYVNNFNTIPLKEPIKVTIYKNNKTILEEYTRKIDNIRTNAHHICEINLNDYSIKEKNEIIDIQKLR